MSPGSNMEDYKYERQQLNRRHWVDTYILPNGKTSTIDVTKLWIGWLVNGAWCPTFSIARHRIDKLKKEGGVE